MCNTSKIIQLSSAWLHNMTIVRRNQTTLMTMTIVRKNQTTLMTNRLVVWNRGWWLRKTDTVSKLRVVCRRSRMYILLQA